MQHDGLAAEQVAVHLAGEVERGRPVSGDVVIGNRKPFEGEAGPDGGLRFGGEPHAGALVDRLQRDDPVYALGPPFGHLAVEVGAWPGPQREAKAAVGIDPLKGGHGEYLPYRRRLWQSILAMGGYQTQVPRGLWLLTACAAAFGVVACGGTAQFQMPALAVEAMPPAPPPPLLPPPPIEPSPAPVAAVARPMVELKAERIEIRETVRFETWKAELQPASYGLLDEIADLLKRNTHVRKVEIQGHTARTTRNRGRLGPLSRRRADAVRSYLIEQGVAGSRLIARGYGYRRPIADNKTREGREANRRVEFVILEQDPNATPTLAPAPDSDRAEDARTVRPAPPVALPPPPATDDDAVSDADDDEFYDEDDFDEDDFDDDDFDDDFDDEDDFED